MEMVEMQNGAAMLEVYGALSLGILVELGLWQPGAFQELAKLSVDLTFGSLSP